MSSVRATVLEALEIMRNGGMIILTDDENRENEGDICVAAQFITPDKINFMVKHCRGLVCLSLTESRCEELGLELMSSDNSSRFGTAFTISIEAREGVTTGISANDRARTILTAVDPTKGKNDLARPGHIFPLRARDGGVLVRAGQTEGSVDLARLSGLQPAGVICEIMKENGEMARMNDLEKFAEEHNLKILTTADLIAFRLIHDNIVEEVAVAKLPTEYGEFTIRGFRNKADGVEAVALVMGDVTTESPVLARVHSQCLTGDVFGSRRCDCGDQLHYAMNMVSKEGRGIILYLFQEGRGIGLLNKIKAYKLQDQGQDTVEANINLGFADDMRDYGFGSQIFAKIGAKKLRILTNNPRKLDSLKWYGIEIVEQLPIECEVNKDNKKYMMTKKSKLGHTLHI